MSNRRTFTSKEERAAEWLVALSGNQACTKVDEKPDISIGDVETTSEVEKESENVIVVLDDEASFSSANVEKEEWNDGDCGVDFGFGDGGFDSDESESVENQQRRENEQFAQEVLLRCESKTPNQCVALFDTHPSICRRLLEIADEHPDLCCFNRLLRSFYPYVPAPYIAQCGAKALSLIADLCDWQKPLRNPWLNNALNKALESHSMLVYADWDKNSEYKRSNNYFWHCFDGTWTLTLFPNFVRIKLDKEFIGKDLAPGEEIVCRFGCDAMCELEHGFERDYSVIGDSYVTADGRRMLSVIIRSEEEPHVIQCWSIDFDRALAEQVPSERPDEDHSRSYSTVFDQMTCLIELETRERIKKSSKDRSLRNDIVRCTHIRLDRLSDDYDNGSVVCGRYMLQSIDDHRVAFVDLERGTVAYQRYEERVKIDGAPQKSRSRFFCASGRVVRCQNGRKRRARGTRSTFYPFFK